MAERLAAPRDASWLDFPGRGGKYHVQRPSGDWVASCRSGAIDGMENRGLMALDESKAQPLDQVPEVLRCRRGGCREHWPANTGEGTDG